MARPRGDESVKRDVALATFDLIAQHGVDGMSMRSLAAATGLSTGTINYHFSSKQGVLLASIEYGYRRRPHEWDEADPLGNLRSLLRRYELTNDSRRTWWRFWLAIASYAQSHEDIGTIMAEEHAWVQNRFAYVLDEAMRQEALSPTYNTSQLGAELVAVAHGHAVAQLIGQANPGAVTAYFDQRVAALRGRHSEQPPR